MGYCTAINCDNNRRKGFRMFRFPRDPVRRRTWLQNCKRANWTPSTSSELCEVHFEKDQFENHRLDGLRKLKPNAVPTIFNISKPSNSSFDDRKHSTYNVKNQKNCINMSKYTSQGVDKLVKEPASRKFSFNDDDNVANVAENFINDEIIIDSSENIVVIERDNASSPTQFSGILCESVEDLCVVEDDPLSFEISNDELEMVDPVLREKIECILSENERLREEVSHLNTQLSQLISCVKDQTKLVSCGINNNVKLKR